MPNNFREQFVGTLLEELNEKFALTQGEERERERFFQMALETYDCLASLGRFETSFDVDPDCASNFINSSDNMRIGLPPELIERWRQWKEDYPGLLKRNPKLEMHDMLLEMEHSSLGGVICEEAVQDWLDGGQRLPLPFDDRLDIATENFYRRFRELRQRVDGWVHFDWHCYKFVFFPEAEWQAIRKARIEERESRFKEEQAKKAYRQRRLTEILEQARADTALWQQLVEFERALEKEAPTPDGIEHRSAIRIRTIKDGLPWPWRVSLMKFVSGLNEPAACITERDIAVHILTNLRRSIGLNPTIIDL